MVGYLISNMEKKAILLPGNRHKSILLLLFCCLFFICSCKRQRENRITIKVYDPVEINDIRTSCFNRSVTTVSEKEYWKIYNQANDTLQSWIRNQLRPARSIAHSSWELDSLMCFNNIGTKLRIFILDQCISSDNCCQDYVGNLYGVKVNQEWYFFKGPTMVLPREYYQDSINTPLSFEKMKQIVTSNTYRGYLKKDRSGNLEINDNFFYDFTSVAWGPTKNTKEQWDSTYLEIVRDFWKEKDTVGFPELRIIQNQEN